MIEIHPTELDARAVDAMCRSGAPCRLLDVREPWENAICALPGSINIPMEEIPERVAELPRDRPLVVICHHGHRSQQVMAWLRSRGFGNAINLQGGMDAWAREVDPAMPTY